MPMLAIAHSYNFLVFYNIHDFKSSFFRVDIFIERQINNEEAFHTPSYKIEMPKVKKKPRSLS